MAVPQPSMEPIALAERGVSIGNVQDLMRFANTCIRSGLAPYGIKTAEAAFVAIEFGMELGLRPMQALNRVCVINGKPSLYGEAGLGICIASGEVEDYDQGWDGDLADGTRSAWFAIRRKGYEVKRGEFDWKRASRAKSGGKRLVDKDNWQSYPDEMLMARAMWRALRLAFPDVLSGVSPAYADDREDPVTEPDVFDPSRIRTVEAVEGPCHAPTPPVAPPARPDHADIPAEAVDAAEGKQTTKTDKRARKSKPKPEPEPEGGADEWENQRQGDAAAELSERAGDIAGGLYGDGGAA